MPVNLPPKADLLLDEADSDGRLARLWAARETCDTAAGGLDPQVMSGVSGGTYGWPSLSPIYSLVLLC